MTATHLPSSIKVVFRDGNRVVAVHAKRARGLLVRYMAEHVVQDLHGVGPLPAGKRRWSFSDLQNHPLLQRQRPPKNERGQQPQQQHEAANSISY